MRRVVASASNGAATTGQRSMEAVDRLAAILSAFEGDQAELSLAAIARAAGLDKSTTARYLWALQAQQFLERGPSGDYRLGLRILRLGQLAIRGRDIRQRARPLLEKLVARFGETVNLGMFDGDRLVLIDTADSPRSLRMGARIGDEDPLHATGLGKAVLAALPPAIAADTIKRIGLRPLTPNTITTRERLLVELKKAAELGFATDNEEAEIGLRCVAVAIRDAVGFPRYAISVSGPAFRLDAENFKPIADDLMGVASLLSQELGFVDRAIRGEDGGR